MPLTIETSQTSECDFAEWSIDKKKRAQLVEVVAYLYLRQEENAQRVIGALEPRRRIPKGKVAENVVRKLCCRASATSIAATRSTASRCGI